MRKSATKHKLERATASVRLASYQNGKMAAVVSKTNLTDFVSDAIDAFAKPILKERGIKAEVSTS